MSVFERAYKMIKDTAEKEHYEVADADDSEGYMANQLAEMAWQKVSQQERLDPDNAIVMTRPYYERAKAALQSIERNALGDWKLDTATGGQIYTKQFPNTGSLNLAKNTLVFVMQGIENMNVTIAEEAPRGLSMSKEGYEALLREEGLQQGGRRA